LIALVKPQFEAGKEKVGKKGVVRDKDVHKQVLQKVCADMQGLGMMPRALDFSPITGPNGNIEYLLLAKKNTDRLLAVDNLIIEAVVEHAWQEHK
jgi:23S rRNA (cytidine1920-2'-O)/16S rRNA (cytidine1409-2'-O)-methyltransferase